MFFMFYIITAVLLVAHLSRDHDISASENTVVAARLVMDDDAIAAFPERIHLSHRRAGEFEYLELVLPARDALLAEGFSPAGAFAVREFAGVGVMLFVHDRERMSATVCEYEGAGVWIDVVSHFEDGRRSMHTTLDAPALQPCAGDRMVALPGATIAELLACARAARATHGLVRPRRDDARARYEDDYARWIADHRQRVAEEAADGCRAA